MGTRAIFGKRPVTGTVLERTRQTPFTVGLPDAQLGFPPALSHPGIVLPQSKLRGIPCFGSVKNLGKTGR